MCLNIQATAVAQVKAQLLLLMFCLLSQKKETNQARLQQGTPEVPCLRCARGLGKVGQVDKSLDMYYLVE